MSAKRSGVLNRRRSSEVIPPTVDEWAAELERITKRPIAAGLTTDDIAFALGLSTPAVRRKMSVLIRAGKWRKVGVRIMERIDGRPCPVTVYAPVKT